MFEFIFVTLGVVLGVAFLATAFAWAFESSENFVICVLLIIPLPLGAAGVLIALEEVGNLAKNAYTWVTCDEDELSSAWIQFSVHYDEVDQSTGMLRSGTDWNNRRDQLASALLEEAESCGIDAKYVRYLPVDDIPAVIWYWTE